jgi:DNA replication protein DnaC
LLIQDEAGRREQKKYALRLRRVGSRGDKTLEGFDFSFNPNIDQQPGFTEWGDAFPNKLLGASTLDRLRHGAYRLVMDGKSYRKPRGYPWVSIARRLFTTGQEY